MGTINLPKYPFGSNEKWQISKSGENLMYIYSAFYDDRPFLNGKNALRILVISTPITSSIYCQMWTKKSSQPLIAEAQILKSDTEIKFGGHCLRTIYFDLFTGIEECAARKAFFSLDGSLYRTRECHASTVSREQGKHETRL